MIEDCHKIKTFPIETHKIDPQFNDRGVLNF